MVVLLLPGHNSKIKISGEFITNKFRASTLNLKDWKWRGKPTGLSKISLGGWDKNSLPFTQMWPKSQHWRKKQRGKNSGRVSSGFEGTKLGKCFESLKSSSGSLAFYFLTPNTPQSSGLQHPRGKFRHSQRKIRKLEQGTMQRVMRQRGMRWRRCYLVLDQNKAGGGKKQLKTFQSYELFFFQLKKANSSGLFSPADSTIMK